MKKSVYSIILADDVVQAVDEMAYKLNTSRSNLINQILAEHVSFTTPEMRIKDIFSQIEQIMDSRFQFLSQPSDTMISLKSPLRYKYKPTIRYSVELFRSFDQKTGRLKVAFRTQSEALINAITRFFLFWRKIEEKYLSEVFQGGVPCEISGGKYIRDFYSPNPAKLTDEEIGNGISEYIKLIDKCIQIYFDGLSANENKSPEIENEYRNYLTKGIKVI